MAEKKRTSAINRFYVEFTRESWIPRYIPFCPDHEEQARLEAQDDVESWDEGLGPRVIRQEPCPATECYVCNDDECEGGF